MKKILLSLSLLAAFSCAFPAFADDADIKKARFDVDQFDQIILGGTFDVDYEMTDGDAYVEVSAPERVMDRLSVKVKDGKLGVEIDNSLIKVNLNFNVKIKAYSKTLNYVELSGACDFDCDKGLVTDVFKAQVNGTGEINIDGLVADSAQLIVAGAGGIEAEDLDVTSLEVKISGAGSAKLKGQAENADIKVAGTGGADMRDLKVSGNVNTSVSGIGKIKR